MVVYTVVYTCTFCVHGLYTAVYTVVYMYTVRVKGDVWAVYTRTRPCTRSVYVYAAVYTVVHTAMYTVVHTTAVYTACTYGRVRGRLHAYTAV